MHKTSGRPTNQWTPPTPATISLWRSTPNISLSLEVSPGDEVRLDTVDALKPAILRGVGDEDFLYLLMPVRVS